MPTRLGNLIDLIETNYDPEATVKEHVQRGVIHRHNIAVHAYSLYESMTACSGSSPTPEEWREYIEYVLDLADDPEHIV